MADREDLKNDDGREWGFISHETFVVLPKMPMLLAGLGPPPFDVKLPDGQMRHVVHRPCKDAGAREVRRDGGCLGCTADSGEACLYPISTGR